MPTSWHDYFITVGGGAAALTGLVFVAMTLHLEDITIEWDFHESRPWKFMMVSGRCRGYARFRL
jgi:hypothetical protein